MPRVSTPLSDQVIVIAGASSGIGRTTARLAAEQGARVVLAPACTRRPHPSAPRRLGYGRPGGRALLGMRALRRGRAL